MQNQLTELAELGRALPPEERSCLVDMLLESLHEEPLDEADAAWDVEVERRLAAYDRGEIRAINGELVLAQARAMAQQ